MSNSKQDQALAFAAICQSAQLVQQVARTGSIDETAYITCLKSLVITDPEHIEEIFGEAANLRQGFTSMVAQLSDQGDSRDVEVTKYVISMLALERKLSKRGEALGMMSERLNQIKRQLHHFEITDDPLVANLASIYTDIISPLGARIQIAGTPALLKQTPVQHKIRALLLAGIRACVLWRQVGGKRRHLLLSRKQMIHGAQAYLDHIS